MHTLTHSLEEKEGCKDEERTCAVIEVLRSRDGKIRKISFSSEQRNKGNRRNDCRKKPFA